MKPGHIPIITTVPLAFNNRHRLIMWRIRTAIYAGADAPPFYQRSPESLDPAAPCPPSRGRGTYTGARRITASGLTMLARLAGDGQRKTRPQPGTTTVEVRGNRANFSKWLGQRRGKQTRKSTVVSALLGTRKSKGRDEPLNSRSSDRPARATFLSKAHRAAHLARSFIGRAFYRAGQAVGLNPSTADETTDDPTIRRCVRFAQDWGYSALCMTNLFALRATKPELMLRDPEPIGRDNNEILIRVSSSAGIIVAAWGAHGGHFDRDQFVIEMLPTMHHLGLTKTGKPRHPLYLRADSKPLRMEATK